MMNSNPRVTRDPETGTYHADASDLGLPPGAWPEWIPVALVDGKPETTFVLTSSSKSPSGEVAYVDYKSDARGPTLYLRIWND